MTFGDFCDFLMIFHDKSWRFIMINRDLLRLIMTNRHPIGGGTYLYDVVAIACHVNRASTNPCSLTRPVATDRATQVFRMFNKKSREESL